VSRSKTIVVLHYFGQMPLMGVAMEGMHYVLGLKRLGHDVWYVEDNGANPYSPQQNSIHWDASYNWGFIKGLMERFGLGDRWAYWDPTHPEIYQGLGRQKTFELFARADALINLCGTTIMREEHMKCPVRVLVDTDPGFEQIKMASGDAGSRAYVDAHTHHWSIGEHLGAADCPVPLGHVNWIRTRPPVVLDVWRPDYAARPTHLSTIATWQHSAKNIELDGVSYQWSKHVNFQRFLDLPNRRPEKFRLAMITPNSDINALVRSHGWDVVDPVPVSDTLDHYAEFIRSSRGEFTVAKDIYVRPRTGWFSDRSVCYLASGRPVITQATGFEAHVPTGRGLFHFHDWDDIFGALDAIATDYEGHCRAARQVAGDCFDSDKVLRKSLEATGL